MKQQMLLRCQKNQTNSDALGDNAAWNAVLLWKMDRKFCKTNTLFINYSGLEIWLLKNVLSSAWP